MRVFGSPADREPPWRVGGAPEDIAGCLRSEGMVEDGGLPEAFGFGEVTGGYGERGESTAVTVVASMVYSDR